MKPVQRNSPPPAQGRLSLPIIAILGFSTMALIGWNLGGSSGKSGRSAGGATAPAERSSRPARTSRTISGPGGEAAQRMEIIRNARTPAERMRATVDLASTLSPSEFAAWMDGGWFKLRDGPSLTLFTKIIQERWKQEDPEGLVLWCLTNKSNEAANILSSWATTEPQRVIDFFKNHPDNRAELQALSTIAKTNPGLALQRLQELSATGVSANDLGYAGGLLQQLAKQSPAALEAALDSLSGSLKTQAEVMIIGQKLQTSFATEFEKLKERPDGMKILQSLLNSGENEAVKGKIFDDLANLPASWRTAIASNPHYLLSNENAAKWAGADLEGLGFSVEQARNLRSNAISQMSYRQPEAALKLLGEIDVPADDRKNLINNIFQYLRDKPEKAESLLAQLGSDEERQAARAVLDSSRNNNSEDSKIEKPADWLEKVAALDPQQGTPYQYLSMLRNWDEGKLTALTEQFKSMPDESKQKLAQVIAGSGYSDKGPLEGEAIRYLIQNPVEPPAANLSDPFQGQANTADAKNIQLASRYIQKMAQNDPSAASDWVQSLPAGDPKLWAQKNLHSLWSQYDPKAADQWMKALPAATQAQVKNLGKKP